MNNKKINLIIQSKGGAGKSFLTYLFALKNEANEKSLFIDLDHSTATSKAQLNFINQQERLNIVNITNNEQKIDRELLFQVLEEVASTEFDEVYIDFGAPESEQLPLLLEIDFTADEFLEFEKGINSKIIFNVVIAGGTNYMATMRYLEKIMKITGKQFEIIAYLNIFTFNQTRELLDEAKKNLKTQKIQFVEFGDFYPDRNSGVELINNMKSGFGFSGFKSFATKTTVKREIAKI